MSMCLALGSVPAAAQTTNYALYNSDGTAAARTYTLSELDHASEVTLQCWIYPTSTTACTLIGQDNFSLGFTEAGMLQMRVGDKTATAIVGDLKNKWTQLTLTYTAGTATLYVNGSSLLIRGVLPTEIPASAFGPTQGGCTIGQGLQGRIDEIRVWKKALNKSELFWNNTLNQYNPNKTELVAYWKGDQNLCENLVDYQGKHHGLLGGMVRQAVTDNNVMRYRVVTGYTNIMRFTDRPQISPEMFRLTNDVILLSGIIHEDGSMTPEVPDNSATAVKVTQLASFEGRNGVMDFAGEGAQLLVGEKQIPYDPTSLGGTDPSQKCAIEGWIYIDTWREGAAIFSNRVDAKNCVEIRLGSEAAKELVVDVNGTIGTLSEQLEVGKWIYVSVNMTPSKTTSLSSRFFNPYVIGIAKYDEQGNLVSTKFTKKTDIVLSGELMNVAYVPRFDNSTMTIGKDFDGKIDNLMVWGSTRSEAFAKDAQEGYTWGSGSWNDIFLNAYWMGDDAQNVGKDAHSLIEITKQMRAYYDGYRGAKIRLGIIYHGSVSWQSMFQDNNKITNLVNSVKKLMPYFDGLDVDLEWMYSSYDWNAYNNVIRRLVREVMALYPDKTFSCSLHTVSYNGFDKSLIPDVDYFTFQMYGPQKETYMWDYFPNSYTGYKNYGYPNDKILLSYGTLLVNNGEEGYKDLFSKYGMTDENYSPDLNAWNCSGTMKYFNGVNQIKRKMEYVIEKDVRGTMYFDMGNDVSVDDYKSLIRAQNDVVSANVDTVIREAPVSFTTTDIREQVQSNSPLEVRYEPLSGVLSLTIGDTPMEAAVYDMQGRCVWSGTVQRSKEISTVDWSKGMYLIGNLTSGQQTKKKLLIF